MPVERLVASKVTSTLDNICANTNVRSQFINRQITANHGHYQRSRSNPGMNRRTVAHDAGLSADTSELKIQLDARISEAKYRQLKLAAVLRGVTV